jgi:glutamate/aspartate transport system ATP-binding protein
VLTDCTTSVAKRRRGGGVRPVRLGQIDPDQDRQWPRAVPEGRDHGRRHRVTDPKTNLSKLRARIGMVFQNFELFPHLSIRENLTIGQVKVLGRSVSTPPSAA